MTASLAASMLENTAEKHVCFSSKAWKHLSCQKRFPPSFELSNLGCCLSAGVLSVHNKKKIIKELRYLIIQIKKKVNKRSIKFMVVVSLHVKKKNLYYQQVNNNNNIEHE